jgi:hypothetical protein
MAIYGQQYEPLATSAVPSNYHEAADVWQASGHAQRLHGSARNTLDSLEASVRAPLSTLTEDSFTPAEYCKGTELRVVESHKRPDTWYQLQTRKDWRLGLFAGLFASLAVLACNISFLLYGVLTHGGVQDGIATIMQGHTKTVSYMSTALHVLINIMSTVLLTSSNYAMQILCAPTRDEIDVAHKKDRWLEIGLMSFRNLSHINTRRALIWWSLAISSAPLHLL